MIEQPARVRIDDDPELAAMANEQNQTLAEELAQNPDLAAAHGIETETASPDSADSGGLDLGEDLARLEGPENDPDGLGELEEFSAEELAIKPAENLADFRDAIAQAQVNGVASIQASKKVIFHYTKPHYPENGFFHYHGIRVEEIGRQAEIQRFLTRSTEEVIFGKKK